MMFLSRKLHGNIVYKPGEEGWSIMFPSFVLPTVHKVIKPRSTSTVNNISDKTSLN